MNLLKGNENESLLRKNKTISVPIPGKKRSRPRNNINIEMIILKLIFHFETLKID